MSERPVRVRIGPSPTGEPHVGTAYIALFNLAFARKHGGKFVLRIEDTDQERSRPEWEAQIMSGLQWLGLQWDEGPDVGGDFGPYRQSERAAIYTDHVNQLLEAGHAYRCFATKEELDELRKQQMARKETPGYDRRHRDLEASQVEAWMAEGRPFVVRMKAPLEGEVTVKDRLRGDVAFHASQIDDQVIMKSDGLPTYHLANVVDDHLMGISHVIRAEEWISSTPKHVLLYQMFGWEPPQFIHMPLLRNKDGSKISKRKNPVSLMDYEGRGFLPFALVNFLSQLGWTMPDGREIFSFEDFIDNFDIDRVVLGGPVFDLEKLTWMNGKYLREHLDDDAWLKMLHDDLFNPEKLRRLVPLIKERIDVAEQFVAATDYFFSGEVPLEAKLLKAKKRTWKELEAMFEAYVSAVEREVNFEAEHLENFTREFVEAAEWQTRDFFMPLRIALTGRKASPPLFDVMSILGPALSRRRLRAAAAACKTFKVEEDREAKRAAKAEKAAKKQAAQGQRP